MDDIKELKDWLIYQQNFFCKNMNKCIEEGTDYQYWAGKLDAVSEILRYIEV